MKKTLILDESIWRCGTFNKNPIVIDDNNNKTVIDSVRGEGDTLLKNEKGYMCCLGQFSVQLDKTIKLSNEATPKELGRVIPLLTRRLKGMTINTKLSDKAIDINDSSIPVKEKVKKIRALFKTKGVRIIFKRKKS